MVSTERKIRMQASGGAYVEELTDLVPTHPMTRQTAFLVGQIQGQEAAKGNVLPLNDLIDRRSSARAGLRDPD
jgi:hypothetical protein